MTKSHEQDHDRDHEDTHANRSALVAPGRGTRAQDLIGPTGNMPSGILMRKARDANGVVADAGDAVARAGGSSGQALPDDLRTKFESSLGADLSGVRVHTGAESAGAAESVGARAYTIGNDIHFGAGEYAPTSPDGQHLLAHEVAHTVQQAGGAAHTQFKLAVSSVGDFAEVDADRAADAMVGGRSYQVAGASSSIMRKPTSYGGNGPAKADDPTQQGAGVESEKDAQKEELEKAFEKLKGTAIGKATILQIKSAGLMPDPGEVAANLQKQAKRITQPYIDRIQAELKYRDQKEDGKGSGQLGIDLPSGKDQKGRTTFATVTERKALEKALNKLLGIGDKASAIHDAISTCMAINSKISELNQGAGKINKAVGLIDKNHLGSVSEATNNVQAALTLIDTATTLLDRTALEDFQANPNFDTAAAWGAKVGEVFNALRPVGALLGKVIPNGDVVGEGLFATPGAVISAFTEVIKARYERIDRKVGHVAGAQLLEDGAQGDSDVQGED